MIVSANNKSMSTDIGQCIQSNDAITTIDSKNLLTLESI